MRYSASGFTIVELLLVIVVIGILATLSLVSYRGIQDRARAAAIIVGIKNTEQAMKLALINSSSTLWWGDEDYLDDDDEPALKTLIAGTNLKQYMSSVPRVGGSVEDDSFWMYDNDGPEDEVNGEDPDYDPSICPQAHRSGGVNIQIELHSNQRLAQQIDDIIDDGNLECGKFREHHSNEGEFLWLLSKSWREVG